MPFVERLDAACGEVEQVDRSDDVASGVAARIWSTVGIGANA